LKGKMKKARGAENRGGLEREEVEGERCYDG
jgi:hypothetical protein